MRVGSLCSGYGGLDLAVEAIWPDATVAWHAETDPHASLVLEKHWPGVPNHGDLTIHDWSAAESVDLITAGFPCQPVSQAGRRKAMADDRWLWDSIVGALGALAAPPRRVLLENVRGLLTAAGGDAMARVVHDLAHLGYVGRYGLLSAAAVGAPHQRERVFIVADLADARSSAGRALGDAECRDGAPADVGRRPTEPGGRGGAPADAFGGAAQLRRGPRPVARPAGEAEGEGHQRQRGGHPAGGGGQALTDAGVLRCDGRQAVGRDGRDEAERGEAGDHRGNGAAPFGPYQPAIDRWPAILGRPAPPGLRDGRLNERLVEWMMGLPDGWVTDLVPRRHALRILGNGVVPQQAAAAYSQLLAALEAAA